MNFVEKINPPAVNEFLLTKEIEISSILNMEIKSQSELKFIENL